jgi:hypothetical protein
MKKIHAFQSTPDCQSHAHHLRAGMGVAGLISALLALPAGAQSDNFDDGNDTAPPPAWVRYNPIGTGSYSFPGGNTYRLQSVPSPDPGNYGPARVGSLLPVSYADFYVAVDIVDWDDSIAQIAGVMARIANAGPGTTRGYLFTHDRGNPTSSTQGDMDIVRVDNEQGTSLETYGADGIHFEPGKTYRLVFMGFGSQFVGQVFELPNTVVPVVEITATDTTYASGYSGLLVVNNASPTYDGGADCTFDNFLAATGLPYLYDNFNDGDDTAPLPAWFRYNPIGTGSYSFPGGDTFRIQSAASPDPGAYGPARAGALRPGLFRSFYVAADIVAWDDSIRQVAGVLARVLDPGPGSTTGYLFSHDRGNPASATEGDMDIVRLDYEQATSLPTTGSDSIHFEPGKQYRLVFSGVDDQFRGQVFELPNTLVPVVDITASDPFYTHGACGLVVANNSEQTGYDGPADATFDNFLMLAAPPVLSVVQSGGNLEVSWPLIPFRLERSATLGPAVWTPVTSGITRAPDRYTCTVPAGPTAGYFRLIYP